MHRQRWIIAIEGGAANSGDRTARPCCEALARSGAKLPDPATRSICLDPAVRAATVPLAGGSRAQPGDPGGAPPNLNPPCPAVHRPTRPSSSASAPRLWTCSAACRGRRTGRSSCEVADELDERSGRRRRRPTATTPTTDPPVQGIYKPLRGERPLWDFPSGLYKREVAAYELAAALGWWVVPPTVVRDGPLGRGLAPAVRRGRLRAALLHPAGARRRYREDFQAICVFDLVANNTDRKSGHCLLGPRRPHLGHRQRAVLRRRVQAAHGALGLRRRADPRRPPGRRRAGCSTTDLPEPLACLLDDDEQLALLERAEAVVSRRVLPRRPHRPPLPLAARLNGRVSRPPMADPLTDAPGRRQRPRRPAPPHRRPLRGRRLGRAGASCAAAARAAHERRPPAVAGGAHAEYRLALEAPARWAGPVGGRGRRPLLRRSAHRGGRRRPTPGTTWPRTWPSARSARSSPTSGCCAARTSTTPASVDRSLFDLPLHLEPLGADLPRRHLRGVAGHLPDAAGRPARAGPPARRGRRADRGRPGRHRGADRAHPPLGRPSRTAAADAVAVHGDAFDAIAAPRRARRPGPPASAPPPRSSSWPGRRPRAARTDGAGAWPPGASTPGGRPPRCAA